ncbi:MAG: 3-oxoadipate--succinyl-CoA transferase subunit B [Chloroflexota bacterium]|nr:MAG: 3-oxoadipate--succinyl-CoA transferase subunit B [Chloroflexota bacterium]
MGNSNYTLSQLMVTAAAREIADGEVIFVGMRLPLLGFLLAKSTHAPNAVGVYELGVIRETVAPAPILTMGDLPNLYRAQWLADTADLMGLLQQGRVDASFIGGAQVDRFGNLNTTYILTANHRVRSLPLGPPTAAGHKSGDETWPSSQIETRLPGSGGACDLASLAQRHIIIMAHEKRRFVPRVDYITSPGYGDGAGWRERVGLPSGGPSTVITTLGVLRFDPETREMTLASTHPGVTVAQVLANTGWPLAVAPQVTETLAPTEAELAMLRQFDPQRFWTKG